MARSGIGALVPLRHGESGWDAKNPLPGRGALRPSAPRAAGARLGGEPPPIADDDELSQADDPRYADLLELLPRTECLADVVTRMLPYWYDALVGDLRLGLTVLVAAHGNSLRALVKHLDGLTDEEVVGL